MFDSNRDQNGFTKRHMHIVTDLLTFTLAFAACGLQARPFTNQIDMISNTRVFKLQEAP